MIASEEHGAGIGRSGLSTGKRRIFAALCVAMVLLAAAGVEGVLRLAGWGGRTPMVREAVRATAGTLMITDPDGAKPYFFAAPPDRMGSGVTDHFWMPKPAGTFRVFLVGGSAIQGFPQPRHLRVSAFLGAMLQDMWPNRTVEVVNLGTTAVASFPVSDILEQALPCSPDLVVIYTGHNEVYGAYGAASSNRAGSRPWMQRVHHRAGNLAVVQAARSAVGRSRAGDSRDLMEIMIGRSRVDPGGWRRHAAARSLRSNVSRMIRRARAAGVPVLVCSLPSNERDLAPIGALDADAHGSDAVRAVEEASRAWAEDPDRVAASMQALLEAKPDLAHAHYWLGKALEAQGDAAAAATRFIRARDLDPMPWRATTQTQQALREAVASEGSVLCDVEALFREHAEGGSIGWALMDDHVHPSLRGQALVAEAIARTIAKHGEPIDTEAADPDRLRAWEAYAAELGDNPFDRYGVDRWAVEIFSIPFMQKANPVALQRFQDRVRRFEHGQPEPLQAVLREWRSTPPICFRVGLALMQQGRHEDALPLLRIAGRAVAPYSSGHLACTYYLLACTQEVQGPLTNEQRDQAEAAIARGELMLRGGFENEGARERFMGRLHYLREEYEEAIPYLRTARERATGQNRLADDGALIDCYRHSGQWERARELAASGARPGAPFAQHYRQWLMSLPPNTPLPSPSPE